MSTSTTATVHNPTNFEPSDYVVENYFDNRRPAFIFGQSQQDWQDEVTGWEKELFLTFGPNYLSLINHCVHCGNGNVRWITAVRHLPTNDVVVFGCDCTQRLGFANKVAFKLALLQSRDQARKVRFAIGQKRADFLAANPVIADALVAITTPAHSGNRFVQDVLSKLDQYGDLSPRQVEAVIASLKRDVETAARKAVEATEIKGDAPEGRVEVTGEVLSLSERETDFGFVTKALIKLANNSKVWLTAPRGDFERGDVITVRATFERSRDDRSFGFGKRPHFVGKVSA